jgi:cytosine/adenosine deaminase-related metal-dependent hydrolase
MAENISFTGVHLAGKPTGTLWDVNCKGEHILNIREHHNSPDAVRDGRFLTPSLCHPHIHLDKCFLLSHQKYSDLEIENGDFAEAMKLTSR